MFETIELSFTIPFPILTAEGWNTIAGFLVAWLCLGSLAMFVMTVTEMFVPYNHYTHGKMFPKNCTLKEEAILMVVAILAWPILVRIIYLNVVDIRWDSYKRHLVHMGDDTFKHRGTAIYTNYPEEYEDDHWI